ncbi:PTS system mannose/fructose/sorbose family transporter subunit IID (plasmid) [Lactiplantibacillus plantarum]|uniref:PTS system mannose/fructose/sorbose family transporter subunit IID n=1 Tax=Lactiplantibacillus plantarum TaxID=1590 RepID=A0AAX1KE29_LACPN|nr:PTS system mannose/fructose/sorbose family transporter subunit IID [Lactiplantibacillus plantarum]QQM62628.1 PTS system mannose/fructose/sorbose family transporter subunit IID [Lactiplantibacillus plantarum]
MSSEKNILNNNDLRRAGWRSFIGSSTFNYNSGMATGILWQLYPALRKIYSNDDDLVKSLDNHLKYYNCNPLISPFVMGATVAMEEQQGTDSLEAVQDMKAGLMGPLSGIGDTIAWVMIPTIFGAIGGAMAKEGTTIGMWLFLAIYVAIFLARPSFFKIGYKQGVKMVTIFGKELSTFTDAISVLGLTVIGAIIPSTINFQTAVKFSNGGVSMTLQKIFDQLLPSLLPVILVAVMYYLMKKKNIKMTTLIIICIIIAMLGAATGVLKV